MKQQRKDYWFTLSIFDGPQTTQLVARTTSLKRAIKMLEKSRKLSSVIKIEVKGIGGKSLQNL